MFRSAFRRRRKVQAFLLWILAAPLPAVGGPREDGEAAFRAGDFARAAALFERAIADGDDSDATRYNLAVSQFRHDDLAQANANFRALYERGVRTADVLYSLAVTEKLLGNTEAAIAHFALLASSASALADAARAQLQTLGTDPAPAAGVVSSLSSSLQFVTGYNDAIVEVQDGRLTRNGDRYAESTASIASQQPLGIPDVSLNLSLYNNSYADTDEQNFSVLGAGLQHTLPWFDGGLYWKLDLDVSQLDTTGFQRSVTPGVGLAQNYRASAWRVEYGYRVSNSLNSAFAPFAGKHHRLQANYRLQPLPRQQFAVRASQEWIARDEYSNAQSTLDLSRELSRIDLTWSYQLSSTLQASAGMAYGEMRAGAYQRFTNGTRLRRDEHNVAYSLSLRKSLRTNFMLQAAFNRSDNRSSLVDFTYDQSSYEVGFAWTPQFR